MQDIQDECGRVAQDMRMQVPLQVSSQTDDTHPVYSTLITAALAPSQFIPETPTLRVGRHPPSVIVQQHFSVQALASPLGASVH